MYIAFLHIYFHLKFLSLILYIYNCHILASAFLDKHRDKETLHLLYTHLSGKQVITKDTLGEFSSVTHNIIKLEDNFDAIWNRYCFATNNGWTCSQSPKVSIKKVTNWYNLWLAKIYAIICPFPMYDLLRFVSSSLTLSEGLRYTWYQYAHAWQQMKWSFIRASIFNPFFPLWEALSYSFLSRMVDI